MLRLSLLLVSITWCSAIDIKAMREEFMSDENFMSALDTCLGKQSMTRDDLKNINKKPEDLPENMLCLIKCIEEEQGYIDSDGLLVMDKISESPVLKHFKDDEKTKMLECVKEVEKIETCSDVKKLKECGKSLLQ